MKYALKIGAQSYTVEVGDLIAGQVRVAVNGKTFDVTMEAAAPQKPFVMPTPAPTAHAPATSVPLVKEKPAAAPSAGSGAVVAPIPGLVTAILVNVGDPVEVGQSVAVIEAMKMENHLTTPVSGAVQEICVQKGAEVGTGQIIMHIG
jgi:biotin carboxyl carrier protein